MRELTKVKEALDYAEAEETQHGKTVRILDAVRHLADALIQTLPDEDQAAQAGHYEHVTISEDPMNPITEKVWISGSSKSFADEMAQTNQQLNQKIQRAQDRIDELLNANLTLESAKVHIGAKLKTAENKIRNLEAAKSALEDERGAVAQVFEERNFASSPGHLAWSAKAVFEELDATSEKLEGVRSVLHAFHAHDADRTPAENVQKILEEKLLLEKHIEDLEKQIAKIPDRMVESVKLWLTGKEPERVWIADGLAAREAMRRIVEVLNKHTNATGPGPKAPSPTTLPGIDAQKISIEPLAREVERNRAEIEMLSQQVSTLMRHTEPKA